MQPISDISWTDSVCRSCRKLLQAQPWWQLQVCEDVVNSSGAGGSLGSKCSEGSVGSGGCEAAAVN